MSDETIDIPDVTAAQARTELAVKLLESGFESYGSGTFWELEGQTISVLLTEAHNDVFFYGETSYRLHYETPQLLLGDWETLMGIEDPEDVQGIQEVVEEPDEVPDYQRDPEAVLDGIVEARSGF